MGSFGLKPLAMFTKCRIDFKPVLVIEFTVAQIKAVNTLSIYFLLLLNNIHCIKKLVCRQLYGFMLFAHILNSMQSTFEMIVCVKLFQCFTSSWRNDTDGLFKVVFLY